MLQIISHIDEYTQTDLKQLRNLLDLATRKDYLIQRPTNWFMQPLSQGEGLGVKCNGVLVGHGMLYPFMLNGQLYGILYGLVWREKYGGGDLVISEISRIAVNRFEKTYGCVRKWNTNSLNILNKYGYQIIDPTGCDPHLLEKAAYGENAFLLCLNH